MGYIVSTRLAWVINTKTLSLKEKKREGEGRRGEEKGEEERRRQERKGKLSGHSLRGLELSQRICISSKFPPDVDAIGLWTIL
jgi:hypothetical protein